VALTLYSETAGDAFADTAEECGTNSCFFCTSPETD